jgi:hypothetical protein
MPEAESNNNEDTEGWDGPQSTSFPYHPIRLLKMSPTTTESSKSETTLSLPDSINAFERQKESTTSITYTFSREELGKAHSPPQEEHLHYTATVRNKPRGSNNIYRVVVELKSPNGDELRKRTFEYSPISSNVSSDVSGECYYTTSEVNDEIESQIWTWAVYLRQNGYHPLQKQLENLGIIDTRQPGEEPVEPGEWHYTTHIDPTSKKIKNKNNRNSKIFDDRTKVKFLHATESGSWHKASLNISFLHGDSDEYPTDNRNDNLVYGTYLYISYRNVKPVEERIDNKFDAHYLEREEIITDSTAESRSVSEILEIVKEAMETLCDQAECMDDNRVKEILAEGERRWDPQNEEYREQTGLTNWEKD